MITKKEGKTNLTMQKNAFFFFFLLYLEHSSHDTGHIRR